ASKGKNNNALPAAAGLRCCCCRRAAKLRCCVQDSSHKFVNFFRNYKPRRDLPLLVEKYMNK
ncbi:hypothetical protein CCACVL1_30363, partial [Corchorus capsularis]